MDEQELQLQEETQDTPQTQELEFDLDDIIKEFSDETEEIAEKTPDQILNEVAREVGAPLPTEEPEQPEEAEEEEPEQNAPEAAPAADATIRFEAVSDVKGTVRNAQRIEDDEEEEEDLPLTPPVQEGKEPYSDEWEPEYEQPIAEYVPQNPIPFRPRSRLRELKKKLVDGPERMYYTLSEKGVGKLQLAMLGCLLILVASTVVTLVMPESRLRFIVFGQFLAMLLSALLGYSQLLSGAGDLLRKRFTLNTMLVFTFLLCLADGIMCLYRLSRVPCCAAFSLQMFMSLWSAYHQRSTRLGQLDTMRKATRLDSITAVADYYDETPGLLRGEGMVEHFTECPDTPSSHEKLISIYALVCAGISIIAGIVCGILHGVDTGIQVAAVTTLAAIPASVFVCLSRPAAILERRYHKLGVVLCGWQGVETLSKKAYFPLDHKDLFPTGSVRMNGVKFFGSRQPDEIVAYTTSLITADGGSLEPLFTQLLDSRNGRHYPATEFRSYGDGGIGGQVCGEPVLCGSISFLKEMGVEIPEGIRVEQAICTAIDGELCGLFAIAYEKNRSSIAGVSTLSGYRKLKTVITTDDFIVTEDFIHHRFGVKTKRMEFPDRETRQALRERSADPEMQAQALITGEGLAPFAYAVTGARALTGACRTGVIVHMIGGILGIAIMLALGILGAADLLSPAKLFLYELIWLIPGLIITERTRSI